jgi:hypothetical protein
MNIYYLNMQIQEENIKVIRAFFNQMKDKNDFLSLLNFTKPFIYGPESIPFKLNQLNYYINPKICKNRYRSFSVKKKSGKERIIYAPVDGLKAIQRCLNLIFQIIYEPNVAATGFVPEKSIVDNAKIHTSNFYIYNIDLKDFFPSIDQARLWKRLQFPPFNLNKGNIQYYIELENGEPIYSKNGKYVKGKGNVNFHIENLLKYANKEIEITDDGLIITKLQSFIKKNRVVYFYNQNILNQPDQIDQEQNRLSIANMIAALCCESIEVERMNLSGEWEKIIKNVLPQGAPTSPVLSNIICERLDRRLTGLSRRFGLNYSRYADDITFSSKHNVYKKDSEFLVELKRIISEQSFHINESKTRLQKKGYRQEVTGLLVNEKVNVPQRYIKQLRMWLYYWERYGYARAYSFFLKQYMADKGNIVKGKPDMANVIGGKLDYLKMVKGAENELYLKLKSRLDTLMGKINPIDELLDVWENRGIDNAMNLYFNGNRQ